jgi:hypothetical protein
VAGRVRREEGRAAWCDAEELAITATIPRGFAGELYVRLHDWDGRGRVSQISYEGRWLETVAAYGGRGVWVRLPVAEADTADGEVVVTLLPEGEGDLVTDFILTSGPASGPDVGQPAK